jgi:hypothetical protein
MVSVTVTACASLGPLLLATIVNVRSVFGADVEGAVFVMARSALALTVDAAVDELFAGFGSALPLVTVAVFEIVEPEAAAAVTFATSVKVALAPLTSVAIVQVTVVVPLQVNAGPLFCVTLTNVVPGGRVSVSDTFDASEGPLFVTAIV